MPQTKSAFIAIVGKPNVGKSSLLNKMVGEKVAIVSNKPQTTRTRITGVLTKGETQLVFIDTPGLHKPRTKLSEYMVKQVKESVADVDAAVLVVEAQGEGITKAEQDLIASFEALHLPAILAINKTDLLQNKESLMARIALFANAFSFDAVFPISAQTGDNVDKLIEELSKYASPSVHFFDDDAMTDQPERVIVAEIIREKLLNNLNEEVPHGTAVVVESFKEREDGSLIDIQATIYCEKNTHKGIIIGKGGAMLKKVGSEARQEIERFLGVKINLQCWVKVKDDWRNREGLIKNFGYNNQ